MSKQELGTWTQLLASFGFKSENKKCWTYYGLWWYIIHKNNVEIYECNWSIAKTLAVCTQYFLAWYLNNQLEISTYTLVLCYDKPYYEICFSYVLESNK